jgi:hypothetical protein
LSKSNNLISRKPLNPTIVFPMSSRCKKSNSLLKKLLRTTTPSFSKIPKSNIKLKCLTGSTSL